MMHLLRLSSPYTTSVAVSPYRRFRSSVTRGSTTKSQPSQWEPVHLVWRIDATQAAVRLGTCWSKRSIGFPKQFLKHARSCSEELEPESKRWQAYQLTGEE